MNEVKYAQPGIITGALASNPAKVLRNTYLLLSMTLLFSAVTASVAMALGLPRGGALLLTLVSFGLLFWVRRTEDSSMGIVAVFAFTGCMGAALGPMLSFYLAMQQGPTIVMQALGGTALVFLTLSGYAMASRKDFSFLGGFLMTGMVVVLVGALANIFLQIPVLSLAIPAASMLRYDSSGNFESTARSPPRSLKRIRQSTRARLESVAWNSYSSAGSTSSTICSRRTSPKAPRA